MKFILLASASAMVVLSGSAPSLAMARAVAPDAAPAADQAKASAAEEQNAPSGISDIVVTANRFSQAAQKTPLILQVINSDQLKGVTDFRQMQGVAPGIEISSSGAATQTFVRGVGSISTNALQESAIAFNLDGVFLYTSSMVTPAMFDIERVEVLKGPQGTLYGRNASGGAINLITKGAKLGQVEGYVEGDYGNYDHLRIAGALNVPLGDTLAIRAAVQHVQRDGYLSDGTDDQDLTSGRLRLRWEPSSDVTVQLGFDGSRNRSIGAGSSLNPNPTNDKFLGALDPRANTGITALGSLPPQADPFYRNDQWGITGQLDWDLGFGTLTVLPAYRSEKYSQLTYVPGYAFSESNRSRQKSLEARIAHGSDALKLVVGGYFFRIDQTPGFILRRETAFQGQILDNKKYVESYAFFGEGTYSLTDELRAIAGIRYSHEKSRQYGTVNSFLSRPGIVPPDTIAFLPGVESGDYRNDNPYSGSAVTWKLGAEYDLSASSMLFATASKGFKGGGSYVDVPLPGADSTYKPEFLTAFELGSRNRFFNNTLQLNAELFYWKLRNQQVTFVGFNQLLIPTLITNNAGKAHMYGGSIDATFKPTPRDTLHVAVEYVKSEYDSFVRTAPSVTIVSTTVCDLGTPPAIPGGPQTIDCSGQPMIRAPKWSGSASYAHSFEFSDGSDLSVGGDLTFSSGRYLDPIYTRLAYQDTNVLFNASATYTLASKAVTLTGWIRNITNERVMTSGTQFVAEYSRPTLMPPRTYGLTARYSF